MYKIYKAFYNQKVFTLKEAKKLFKNYQVCKNTIHRLIKKKSIKRIKPGIYFVVPFDDERYIPNPIWIGSFLRKDYFFSHLTALQIHDYMSSPTIYISSDISKTFKIFGTSYTIIKTNYDFGIEQSTYSNVKVRVSDLERTFLDCLLRIDYFNSFDEFLNVAQNMPLRFKILIKYLTYYDNKRLYALTGYVLELLKDKLGISDLDLKEIEKGLGKKTYYMTKPMSRVAKIRAKIKSNIEHSKRWHLVIER
jgi:predicted transcriptional regulator of viral defense system